MLRPSNNHWFGIMPADAKRRTDRARAWCEWATDILHSMVYGHSANFQRAMSEADKDFAAFGNAVTAVTEDHDRHGLLFTTYHLRNCAWSEDGNRRVNVMYRRIPKMSLRNKRKLFGDKAISPEEKEIMRKNPDHEVEILHVVLPLDSYDPFTRINKRHKFADIYLCPKNYQACTYQ